MERQVRATLVQLEQMNEAISLASESMTSAQSKTTGTRATYRLPSLYSTAISSFQVSYSAPGNTSNLITILVCLPIALVDSYTN